CRYVKFYPALWGEKQPASLFPGAAGNRRIEKIGLELYTVRYALAKDFEGTLTRVEKIGYKEVEFAGSFDNLSQLNPPPKRTRQILDGMGLAAPSSHVAYTAFSPENWPRVLEAAHILGHNYIVNPSIDRQLSK